MIDPGSLLMKKSYGITCFIIFHVRAKKVIEEKTPSIFNLEIPWKEKKGNSFRF